MGAGPECFFAGHGQSSAGVVDPLHGGSCGDTVFIPLGHPHHLPAGSGLCLRPGLRSGRAGGQRRVAAALLPLASAQRGRQPVTAASGGGLRRRFRLHLGAGAQARQPQGPHRHQRKSGPRGRRHGGDGLRGEQPAVLGRLRGGHERLLHPHAGGHLRRAHPDGPARTAAGGGAPQRACRHGRGAPPPVRAVQAEQRGHPAHQQPLS